MQHHKTLVEYCRDTNDELPWNVVWMNLKFLLSQIVMNANYNLRIFDLLESKLYGSEPT